MTIEQVEREALALPLEDREQLTERILKSMEKERSEIDAEWLAVAERRLAAIRNGEATLVDHDEVMRQVDRHLDEVEQETTT